jgi:hypothetical protein
MALSHVHQNDQAPQAIVGDCRRICFSSVVLCSGTSSRGVSFRRRVGRFPCPGGEFIFNRSNRGTKLGMVRGRREDARAFNASEKLQLSRSPILPHLGKAVDECFHKKDSFFLKSHALRSGHIDNTGGTAVREFAPDELARVPQSPTVPGACAHFFRRASNAAHSWPCGLV